MEKEERQKCKVWRGKSEKGIKHGEVSAIKV